ncbi:hypothetical protein A1O7_02056 [Cladophialophora yegresii CBS 114405]|uniref:Sterigmatocystin biosynthesis monooxygenase stcW n=1 Tax=Cladophialophora yegresii CBS 114405 TaxID=1182544 RepID=W9W0L9_9EURO|nr:uncharacterized protein A1O7_02056 [Cladophialophora yegresii CBS 114405]EXJ61627.1 hypothetical protein A1O7_02056 [Cladophialophora yegresii CBS 114405]
MSPSAVIPEGIAVLESDVGKHLSSEYKLNGQKVTEIEVTNHDDSIAGPDCHPSTTPPQIPRLDISIQYQVKERPLGWIRPIRIICLGAGASGVNLAYQVQQRLKKTELVVYEKNPAIGGTWYENRYPGCKCDIPSHNYQFSWEPNPDWTEMFSTSSEIRAYLQKCVDKHNLGQYFKLSHNVVGSRWEEATGKWHISVRNHLTNETFEDTCDFFVNAGGILNNWKWPDVPGLHDFRGRLVHSANWPMDWDYEGLKVAVLGNGSSGIQIVPTMQPRVKELVHLVRSATWVTPSAPARYAALLGRPMPDIFSDEQKESFRNDPEVYLRFRIEIERETNKRFPLLLQNSQKQRDSTQANYQAMLDRLGPEAAARYAKEIIPDFPVGCRRITPGLGYLESFSQPNVRVITNAKIQRVDEKGIRLESGEHIEVDAIVCATGFDVSFTPRFPITGRDGISLKDVWSKPNIPFAYLSTCIPKFPNYFVLLGPNAPIAHGSVLAVTEHCSKYLLQMITKAQTEGIRAIDVKQSACNDFMTHVHHFMPRTTWAAQCRSWFKGGQVSGPVTAIHPGSRVHWFHMMERPKFEDFDYDYEEDNRFAYLGNGFSRREMGIYDPGTVEGWNPEEGDLDDLDDTWFVTDTNWKYLYY